MYSRDVGRASSETVEVVRAEMGRDGGAGVGVAEGAGVKEEREKMDEVEGRNFDVHDARLETRGRGAGVAEVERGTGRSSRWSIGEASSSSEAYCDDAASSWSGFSAIISLRIKAVAELDWASVAGMAGSSAGECEGE